jgi:hypothetical protein
MPPSHDATRACVHDVTTIELLTIPRECLLGHDLVYVRRKANATCESRVDEEVRRLERVCAGMTLRTTLPRGTHGANRTDASPASHSTMPFDSSRAKATSFAILAVALVALLAVAAVVAFVCRMRRRRRHTRLLSSDERGATDVGIGAGVDDDDGTDLSSHSLSDRRRARNDDDSNANANDGTNDNVDGSDSKRSALLSPSHTAKVRASCTQFSDFVIQKCDLLVFSQ